MKSRSPGSPRPRPRPGHPYLAGSPLLIAHRGGAGLAPENTLAAFENAVHRWGADMLEMDVQSTRDGEVVVIHDETVDRTTDGTGKIRDLTLAAASGTGCRVPFQGSRREPLLRGKGVTIPRFEEVLEALPEVRLNVEAKDGRSAPGLVETIRRHGPRIGSWWRRSGSGTDRAVRGYPGPWGASRRDLFQFFFLIHSPLGRFYTPACDALQIPEVYLGIRILTDASSGRPMGGTSPSMSGPWTIPQDMKRLVAMGVDGIQTDRPDLLAPVLTEMVGRPPPPAASRAADMKGRSTGHPPRGRGLGVLGLRFVRIPEG